MGVPLTRPPPKQRNGTDLMYLFSKGIIAVEFPLNHFYWPRRKWVSSQSVDQLQAFTRLIIAVTPLLLTVNSQLLGA